LQFSTVGISQNVQVCATAAGIKWPRLWSIRVMNVPVLSAARIERS
jgi:hypothetical protein